MGPQFPKVVRYALAVLIVAGAGVLLAVLGAYQYLRPSLPDISAIKDVRVLAPLRIYSRDGKLIQQFGEQRRIPLALDDIPSQMVDAVLAAEDDRFFQHDGLDYPGLLRSIVRHLLSGDMGEGGSTITMQLTRGIFLTREKTYRRKLLEIFLTVRIERELTKQEILTLYLNKSYLGLRAYGIGAAAEVYFGKSVHELTLSEAAVIAGTFRLPSRDNPVANADLARQRRSYVLRRMHEKQFITEAQYRAALAAPIESKLHGSAVELEAPYVGEMVRVELLKRLGAKVDTAGYKVVTTIDSRLQRSAVRALRTSLIEYDERHGYRGPAGHVEISRAVRDRDLVPLLDGYRAVGDLAPAVVLSVEERSAVAYSRRRGRVSLPWSAISWARRQVGDGIVGKAPHRASDVLETGDVIYVAEESSGDWRMVQVPEIQGAFVAMDPQDGAVAALVGGFDFFASNFNRAVQTKRQPGSTFKPFLYSAALDKGFTAASILNDAPTVSYEAALEGFWRPENSTRTYLGPISLREALYLSRNTVSRRVIQALGVPYVANYAMRFGFSKQSLPRNESLALGTGQASPLDMATAYSVFANGGYRVQPYYIQRIVGPGGAVTETEPLVVCASCPESSAIGTQIPSDGGSAAQERIAPRVISAANNYIVTDMLADVIKLGTARRAQVLKREDLAGKTGTTDEGRDIWFCGFNSQLVATAWAGFDQFRPLGDGEDGSRTPLSMWIYFMAEALQGVPEQRRILPPGVVEVRISPRTGRIATANDADFRFELFMADRLPAQAPGDDDSDVESRSRSDTAPAELVF
jgi:penicillin-binding protein 1A